MPAPGAAAQTGDMTPDLHRRLGLALFLAMSLATAAGLSLLPAFDPVAGLRPLLGAGAGVLLVAAAAAGSQFTLRRLGVQPWLRPLAWATLGLATGVWLFGGSELSAAADGRALLWLVLTPLWLTAAGLGGSGKAQAGVVSRPSARHSSSQTAG